MKKGLCPLLFLYACVAVGQTSSNPSGERVKYKRIFKYTSHMDRIRFLDYYMRKETGDSAGFSTSMDNQSCLLMYLSLDEEKAHAIKDFVRLPVHLFRDSITIDLLHYQDYCLAAKKVGNELFRVIPTKLAGHKRIVLVMKAARKEKCFYVELEQKEGVTSVRTADFLTNKYETIPWEESNYIYQDTLHNATQFLVRDKKSFSVGDRMSIVGWLYNPAHRISIAPPQNDSLGVVYYTYYLDMYESLDSVKRHTLRKNLSATIVPYVFRDSVDAYGYFLLQVSNSADSVFDYWMVRTGNPRIYRSVRTKAFLDFVLPGLPRVNAHEIIKYKRRKTLLIEFSPSDSPFWDYDTERAYKDYLNVFLFDAKLKNQRRIKSTFIRFKHSDGSKSEFIQDMDLAFFKDLYQRAYFRISGYGTAPAFYLKQNN